MRVALLSPFIHPIRDPFVGGTEASIYRLATGLSRQGVSVVCYACEGSVIPGVEIRTCGVAASALAYPHEPNEMSGEEILAIRAYEDVVMYRASAGFLLLSHRFCQSQHFSRADALASSGRMMKNQL